MKPTTMAEIPTACSTAEVGVLAGLAETWALGTTVNFAGAWSSRRIGGSLGMILGVALLPWPQRGTLNVRSNERWVREPSSPFLSTSQGHSGWPGALKPSPSGPWHPPLPSFVWDPLGSGTRRGLSSDFLCYDPRTSAHLKGRGERDYFD